MTRIPLPPSAEVIGLSKKRSKKCRARTTNLFMRTISLLRICACTSRDKTGCSGGVKTWKALCMRCPHHFDHFVGDGFRVLLLDQLREDAFETRQLHKLRQLRRRCVRTNLSLGDHNDAAANLLDNFKHMRNVEDGFTLGGERR